MIDGTSDSQSVLFSSNKKVHFFFQSLISGGNGLGRVELVTFIGSTQPDMFINWVENFNLNPTRKFEGQLEPTITWSGWVRFVGDSVFAEFDQVWLGWWLESRPKH